MIRPFRASVWAAAVILGAAGAVTAARAAEAPAEAVAVVDGFQRALAAGDRAKALGALDPAVVIFESGGAELSRSEYEHHHLGADMEFTAATKSETVDRRSGTSGDLAWVITRSKTTGRFRDKEVASAGTETMLLARDAGGAWRIVHIHWSSHNVKKG